MQLQKTIYLAPEESAVEDLKYRRCRELLAEEPLLGNLLPNHLPVQLIPAPSRDADGRKALVLRVQVQDGSLARLFPNLPAEARRWLTVEALADQGWEPVPEPQQICYLHGEIRGGELASWMKSDLGFRHYRMRNQLLPNITRHYLRFVLAYPDVLAYLAESYSSLPGRCYLFSRVVQRVLGKPVPLDVLAEENGLPLNGPEDIPGILHALAGRTIRYRGITISLDPVDWPVYPLDLVHGNPNRETE